MSDKPVVVIKFGGGLITDKSKLCTPKVEVIERLARVISRVREDGMEVVLVHGAGSFAHLTCKDYALKDGYSATVQGQQEAVATVHRDMTKLCEIVCNALSDLGVPTRTFPPYQWARNTGPSFDGDLTPFTSCVEERIVGVTFGDVVPADSEKQFGILSGDDIVVRLSQEIPRVARLVFAMVDAPGLLRSWPPDSSIDIEDQLIREYNGEAYEGVHNAAVDVTGGIDLKVHRGTMVAKSGVDVWLVDGEEPERVYGACLGQSVVGTKIPKDVTA